MKKVYVSQLANETLLGFLRENGYEPVTVGRLGNVDGSVGLHPDMYICRTPDGKPIKAGSGEVGGEYPENIGYNAVMLGNYLVHKLRYTAESVLSEADRLGLVRVNVKQGFTKCSTAIVTDAAVMTSDKGIARTLRALPDVEVLEIAEGHIKLQGYAYGFIGGASGRVGDMMIFNGDLEKHPDFERIVSFVRSHGLRPVWFGGFELEDIGTIIEGESCEDTD